MTAPRRTRRTRRRIGAVCAVSTLLGVAAVAAVAADSPPARADSPPGLWDDVVRPDARVTYRVHQQVWRLLVQARAAQDLPGIGHDYALSAARVLLDDAHAAESPDPLLRFDLGYVLEQSKLAEPAVAVLVPALAAWPDHPAATNAWLELAYAYARLDRPQEELAAYGHFLAATYEDDERSTALLNMAEAEMRLGHLDEAVAEYDDAAALGSRASLTPILAAWGKAVALDRAGRPGEALRAAVLADALDPILPEGRPGVTAPGQRAYLQGKSVFFVPDYEIHWYLALGLTAAASAQGLPAARVAQAWHEIESTWHAYVDAAAPTERWLPLARAHLDAAHRRAAEADARAARARPAR